MVTRHKGLGDTIEMITVATGVKKLVKKATEIMGVEDCGCNKRKETLNNIFPYGK
jgi:hypothetical protein